MIFNLYSMRDRLSGFLPLKMDLSDEIAIRSFCQACEIAKKDDSMIGFRPSDFSLYCVGSFDTESGKITSFDAPKFLVQADQFRKDDENDV